MRWYFWILAAALIVVVFWFFKNQNTSAVSGLEGVLNENQVRSPAAGTLGGIIHRRR